ncbi:hypothetical protein CMI37_13115 [Candidatus Pacearchaeota archaeon]|nr:hypothetical protein [Candidatus Pacearchaeota archaeon]|tara:strand:+ start:7968 stop:8603 length:636 start_codon:yes stop_codon:yes gene_type:complete
MAVTNGYCTLAELRAQISITEAGDTTDDSVLEQRIEAISRAIDYLTGRRFYTTDADESRYYSPPHPRLFLCPDDILSITTLKTDEDGDLDYDNTWSSSTDYFLEPYNAAVETPPRPFTRIRTMVSGNYGFPTIPKGTEITGKFGYSTAANQPPQIKAATLLAAQKAFMRRGAPFGLAGGPNARLQLAAFIQQDLDVMMFIEPFKRTGSSVI